jgi:hypothetical protein
MLTPVSVLPEASAAGTVFRAIAGSKQSTGQTVGQAIDALNSQLSDDERKTLVIVQSQCPDEFFTAEQQQRLGVLMDAWRSARDRGTTLSLADQQELEALSEAEILASSRRAAAILQRLGQ